jgi:hypothetical protein
MPGDIARLRKLMPSLGKEEISPTKDYRYRAFTTHEGLREGMANLADSIDYGNFKSEVEKTKRPAYYKNGLHKIWDIMSKWQPGGPYGWGNGQPIPKNEEKQQVKLFAEKRKAHSGQPCDDCGEVRGDEEMILLGNRWLCSDVSVCDTKAKHF